jgi:nucleoside-diphosphate-sugar epimerase
MKVLITGACGFVARELIAALEARGHELVLLDRVSPEDATLFVPGQAERVKCPLVTKWTYWKAEIADAGAMRKAARGVDAVVHLAAAVSGLPEHGIATMHTNVCGTYVVLEAAHQAGVRRVLCASSINAFGTMYWRLSKTPVEYRRLPLDESFEAVPEDPYSLSKLCNEQTCAAFSRAYGMTTAALRFAGMWTREQYATVRAAGPSPTRSWSNDLFQWAHVADIAAGIRQALEFPDLPSHGVYTLAAADTRCPEPTLEILERFQPELARSLAAPLSGRAPLLSIRRAQEAFGYAPAYRLWD